MKDAFLYIKEQFSGKFLTAPGIIRDKLVEIKAFVFDWDGVFNNGMKDENGSSPFSEVDAMGTNMLRFNHYLRHEHAPVVAVISGETNKAAFTFAKREHFNTVYYKMPSKKESLLHLCQTYGLEPYQVAFVFDDILDLSVAELCGLRIAIGRASNPLLLQFIEQQQLADYITFNDGGNHAVRESAELLLGLSGQYDETITHRMNFTETYRHYLLQRNTPETLFYTNVDSKITEQWPEK